MLLRERPLGGYSCGRSCQSDRSRDLEVHGSGADEIYDGDVCYIHGYLQCILCFLRFSDLIAARLLIAVVFFRILLGEKVMPRALDIDGIGVALNWSGTNCMLDPIPAIVNII